MMHLREALAIGVQERVISIIGGGGKTTLLYRLAADFAAAGERVLLTTTTKMFRPAVHEVDELIITGEGMSDMASIVEFIGRSELSHREKGSAESGAERCGERIFLAGGFLPGNKIRGIETGQVTELTKRDYFNYILVEADGAARRSGKGYAAHEPNIPAVSDLVIIVAGLDLLGGKLTASCVHRAALAAKQIGFPEGADIDEEVAARLIALGVQKAWRQAARARRAAFLNKADNPQGLEKGMNIAKRLLSGGLVERVLIGSCLSADPVAALLQ
ncbi:MAG: putative selenium-dependent hydroxylase accessory protein YqeC [Firmicutes bacterium]|nr:putative selenium-dependent hydroxylase accessory protein YqeC [Bacillota bacterium]